MATWDVVAADLAGRSGHHLAYPANDSCRSQLASAWVVAEQRDWDFLIPILAAWLLEAVHF